MLYRFIARTELKTRLPEYFAASSALKFICFILALIFLGIALMKPYDGFEKYEIKRKGVDLYFLVDVSPSMNAEDVKPSRLDRARFEIKDFLKALTGDRVGLIGFSGEAFVLVPLTGDYDAFDLFLGELESDLIPVPGTNIKGAMEKAVAAFKTQELASSKAIILISDGEDSVGLDSAMIADIRKHDIKIFIIGIGTPEGAPIPLPEGGYKRQNGQIVLSRLNENALQDLARATGGGYVRSVSGDLDLNQIYFGGIKKSFKDAEYGTAEKKLPRYRFQWALVLGFAFLTLEALIPKKKPFAKTRLSRNAILFGIFFTTLLGVAQPVSAKNPILFGQAGQAFEKGEYDKALESYLKLKEKNPNDPEIDYNLGETYYRLENYDAAEEAFERALNIPDETRRKETLYNLGNTAYRQNKLDEALSYYEKALQMDPNYDKAKLNYEFVKKKKEEQKEQEQKKEDQQKNEEQKQEESQKKEQQEKEQSQKQEEQNERQKKQDKQEQNQDEKQSQNPDQKQKEQGEKDKENDQQEQKEGDKQKQDEGEKQKKEEKKSDEQQESEMTPKQTSETGTADKNPQQWLQSLSDNPGKALKYLIEKKSLENPKRFDKDW